MIIPATKPLTRAHSRRTFLGRAAAAAGVSGALYGSLIGRLSTETFSLSASLSFLTMAVIGGLGSEVGAVLGAAFLAVAPEVLRQFKDAEMVVYGAILVLCMLFLPSGLAGLGRRWIFSR